jgi:DNA anti-recombination protein RmuC
VTAAKKWKDRPFLTVEEENTVFQLNYSKTLGTKSYRCHGRGYLAKYPTRSALLKQREEDAAHSEVLAQHERMQHQQEVEELKEKLTNEVSARERDKEESMKQIKEIREEFRSTLQQQIQLALQQVLTLEHGSPFFGSSILANVLSFGLHRLLQEPSTPHSFQMA